MVHPSRFLLIHLGACALALFLPAPVTAQNYALRFEGAQLEFPHHPIMNTGDAFTAEAWVRTSGAQIPNRLQVLSRYQPSAEHKDFSVSDDGTLTYIYAGSPWPEVISSPNPGVTDGSWHHMAFVRRASGDHAAFVDGIQVAGGGPGRCWSTCNVINASPSTFIGQGGIGGAQGWDVDAIRISSIDRYWGTFTPPATLANDANCAMLLNFNEGAGSLALDEGPAQQVGAFAGTYSWVQLNGPPGNYNWILNPANGHRYALTAPKSWLDAAAEADSLGPQAQLVTIRSQQENDWLFSTFNVASLPHDSGVWIGLTDAPAEGTWSWRSGESVNYSNWHGGEPSNCGGNENFAHFYTYTGGTWNDGGGSCVPGNQPMAAILEWTDLPPGTYAVHSQSNIYGAGHAAPPAPGGGGGGILPLEITIPAGASAVQIKNVTGTTYWAGANQSWWSPADGRQIRPWSLDVLSHDGIAGVTSDYQGFLAGVFLDAQQPQDPAPPRRDFSGAGREFLTLAPDFSQTFYVGDGLGGANNDQPQIFFIPPGATRLLLGYHDCYQWVGLPGYYHDNSGALQIGEITFLSDTDLDGLDDADEIALGTDPLDQDTDDDGLGDGEEALTLATNPLLADTDSDLVQDGTELGRTAGWPGDAQNGILGTDLALFIPDADPVSQTSALDADTDDDGIPEGAEDGDLNGAQSFGEPDSARFDTDGDDLGDGLERGVSTAGPGTDPLIFVPDADPATTTDPLAADTDLGGNPDGAEDWNGNGAFEFNEGNPNVAADDHFTLTVQNLVAGQVATISASGARPFQRVTPVLSRAGQGPINTPQGFVLNLTPPLTKLPFFTANVAGNGFVTVGVPPFLPPGTVIYWQAVEVTTGGAAFRTSNALVTVSQ